MAEIAGSIGESSAASSGASDSGSDQTSVENGGLRSGGAARLGIDKDFLVESAKPGWPVAAKVRHDRAISSRSRSAFQAISMCSAVNVCFFRGVH